MKFKQYIEEDLKDKKYAVIETDAEDGTYAIVSLHNDYDKALKRAHYLDKKVDVNKWIGGYGVYEITDKKVRASVNYELEW